MGIEFLNRLFSRKRVVESQPELVVNTAFPRIDKSRFVDFMNGLFGSGVTYFDEFKPDVWFMEVDCFASQDYKLALAISDDDIRISTVSKVPELDFSLYDYVFYDIEEAKELVERVNRQQFFKKP